MSEPLYLIWASRRKAWWRPGGMGYCIHHSDAGRFPKAEAEDICRGGDEETCYPETDARFHSDTPRADKLIAELAYQFPGTEGYNALEEIQRLERELAQRTAEVEVLRGVGCEEDGDGSCGVCIKCYSRDARRYRELRRWPTIELLNAFNAPADGTSVPAEELDEAVDHQVTRHSTS